jgi:hypothetical protein
MTFQIWCDCGPHPLEVTIGPRERNLIPMRKKGGIHTGLA